MTGVGIDIGYSSVKVAVLDQDKAISAYRYVLHKGQPAAVLQSLLTELRAHVVGDDVFANVVGCGASLLTSTRFVDAANELSAIIQGVSVTAPECQSIIQIGGQRAGFITGMNAESGKKLEFSLNPDCSAGTGSFLEEQSSRIGVDIQDYSALESNADFTPRIAGRCSVFAKTDITHHQQEGVSIPNVLRGLAYATARNYRNAVMRGLPKRSPMYVAGGVAKNTAVLDALRSVLSLGSDELFENRYSSVACAVGAGVLAMEQGKVVDYDHLCAILSKPRVLPTDEFEHMALNPLAGYGQGDSQKKHITSSFHSQELGVQRCWLGVDVGSTSTNLVVVDSANKVLGFRYLRTAGNPVQAVTQGLKELGEELGQRVHVCGCATTGSGRYMISRLIGADVVKDEITAQARAAVEVDPDVDTLFEIGGQDSKYISIQNSAVVDFQMNKVCAAGTGSFIEEQAKKIGIELNSYADIAFKSSAPINLGERCTVFMETSIATHLSQGAALEDVAAGLCYSIVKNYINRVVGQRHIGDRILLQGGVAYNQAIVNAFRSVTGKDVIVPPFFSVTGALGAAILAREEAEEAQSLFKGFELTESVQSKPVEPERATEVCGFNQQVQEFIFAGYTGEVDPTKITVGMPRALFTYGMFPLFYPFFKKLGVNVVLSEPTSPSTIQVAQEYSLDETCYPVKLINGHAAELVDQNVDYIFFPDLFTASHPSSKSRQNYGCPYMQLAFKIINEAMGLQNKNIELLSPTIAFNQGPDFMQNVFMDVGARLGKGLERTQKALKFAMKKYNEYQTKMKERSQQNLASLDLRLKTFVLISKIYGVADPVLNMGIPDKLAAMGYQTVPLYDLPEADIFMEHPNMYWPFGQHMLAATKLVANQPNLYPIFLTHHGCGPDTVFSHYYKELLGDKPALFLEVDEHSSDVGVQTRLEAFVNSLQGIPVKETTSEAIDLHLNGDGDLSRPVNIATSYVSSVHKDVLLPSLYPYSDIFCAVLNAKGIRGAVLPPTTRDSIDLGRQFSSGNEYFSLTALLGDVLSELKLQGAQRRPTFIIPQNEGAEVDGQYSRFVRCVLEQQGYENVEILSPYLEDLGQMESSAVTSIGLALLAGDLVLHTPLGKRQQAFETIMDMIDDGGLSIEKLEYFAGNIRHYVSHEKFKNEILAIGEPLVLYNQVLNDGVFEKLERQGHRVVYAPFGECLWSHWRDNINYSNQGGDNDLVAKLEVVKKYTERIAERLEDQSHYSKDMNALKDIADKAYGFYSGGFGRYRGAKALEELPNINGIISVTSMYENTGISLGILKDRVRSESRVPTLSLTFDGNKNENNGMKIESFVSTL
ncbi:MAG: acyl-CoA dehydratase activase [Desulfovibrio sp.]